VSLEDASKRLLPVDLRTGGLVAPELANADPFTTVTSKRTSHPQTSFVIPISPNLTTSQQPTTDTPELLKYSHQNPFSAIQPNNQQHPLHKAFSYSWRDSEILHDTGLIKDGESRDSVRKRLACEDFDKKRKWEIKRFKKAGCDLRRYNRGDFGPRTGIGRL
jgi:ubiquitin-conjugating enzyme E2 S